MSGLDVTGQINIEADNVIVENTRITGTGVPWDIYVDGENTIIRDVELTQAAGSTEVAEGVHDVGGPMTIDGLYSHGIDNAVHGDGSIENSYMLSTFTFSSDHVENIYCDTTGGLMVDHDTILNPTEQTATVFCNTNNGSSAPCQNHLTVENSLLSGGGYTVYPCGNASSVGSSVIAVENNRFARCTGTPVKAPDGEGTWCLGEQCSNELCKPDGHGYFPNGGYFGIDADNFCGAANNTWSGNVWDDDNSAVGC